MKGFAQLPGSWDEQSGSEKLPVKESPSSVYPVFLMCQKECWRGHLVVRKNIVCLYPWTQRIRQPIKAAMTIKCNEGHDGGDRVSCKACKGTWSGLEVGESCYRESPSTICGARNSHKSLSKETVLGIASFRFAWESTTQGQTGKQWKPCALNTHSLTHYTNIEYLLYVTLCPRHWGYSSEQNRVSRLPGAHILPFIQGLRHRGVRRERS